MTTIPFRPGDRVHVYPEKPAYSSLCNVVPGQLGCVEHMLPNGYAVVRVPGLDPFTIACHRLELHVPGACGAESP